ncbi:MAG: DUF5686 family protein [Prevotellaceae bacterium]|jgi:hypothetical protein|nr:DUF5686 family protein [Prevotellaceae bacterium]
MREVMFYAPLYESIIDGYKAELYVKSTVNLQRRNQILKFMPTMFRTKRQVREYVMETYSDLHFTAPDIYNQKVQAAIGTSSKLWELDGRLPDYFHINVYAPVLLNDKLMSPLAPGAPKFYTYHLDSVSGDGHNRLYRISFKPRNENYQLVEGYLTVTEGVWSIREMSFVSRSEMFRLRNHITMGNVGADDEFLPVNYLLNAKLRFLGNVAYADYNAVLRYKSIREKDPVRLKRRKRKQSRYDLTDSYIIRTDSNAYRHDTAYFNNLRMLPLTPREQQLYRSYYQRQDTLQQPSMNRQRVTEWWGQVGDALISRNTIDMSKMGSIRFSPLINPFLLSYSRSNGFAYRQDFRYTLLFTGDRMLHIRPRVGYNFTHREFYWSVNGSFDYWPRKRASLHIDMGNGNRIYSSDVLNDLKNLPDTTRFDFSQLHLDYFRDLYLKVRHSWEMTNGLTLDVGISMHRRSAINPVKLVPITSSGSDNPDTPSTPDTPIPPLNPGFTDKIRTTYVSFAPRVRLTWNPGQYYYMEGDRKINMHARYPGISIDWERGVKGVFGSQGKYERIELDAQYSLSMGSLRKIHMRLGGGAFTNQEEMYFVDFANFTRSNLPVGWNDEIGGTFQLLRRQWYNSSHKYVRGHFVYDSPFLLVSRLPFLNKATRFVLSERLYLNALVMPLLEPSVEVGYGIGTNIFDFGVFAGFANNKFKEVGCTFTFELFNR